MVTNISWMLYGTYTAVPWHSPPPACGDELALAFSEPNQNQQSPVCLKNSKPWPSGVAHHLQAGQWLKAGLFLVSLKDTGLLPYKIFVAFLLLLVKKNRPEGMAVVNIRAQKQNVVAPGTGQCSRFSLCDSEGRMHDKGCKPFVYLPWLMDIGGTLVSGII